MKKTNYFIERRLKELNDIEKEKYNYYRNQLREWCYNYPANENSNNFKLVKYVLYHLSYPISKIITLSTPTSKIITLSTPTDILSSSPTLIEEANNYFYEKKHFRISEYYFRIFNNVGEMVSYWNAFDSNKNENLEMDL